jgi:hypothetical protein
MLDSGRSAKDILVAVVIIVIEFVAYAWIRVSEKHSPTPASNRPIASESSKRQTPAR